MRGLIGAAGAWGQCAPASPGRLADVGARPLNFTVRRHRVRSRNASARFKAEAV